MKPVLNSALVISLLTSLMSLNAFAGAVSAGGRMASVKVECVFVDPTNPTVPYNFAVYDLSSETTGGLSKVDLVKQTSSYGEKVNDIVMTKADGVTTINGAIPTDRSQFEIKIDENQSLAYADYSPSLAPIPDLKGVTFDREATGFASSLAFGGKRYEGICASQYFIFYYLRR